MPGAGLISCSIQCLLRRKAGGEGARLCNAFSLSEGACYTGAISPKNILSAGDIEEKETRTVFIDVL